MLLRHLFLNQLFLSSRRVHLLSEGAPVPDVCQCCEGEVCQSVLGRRPAGCIALSGQLQPNHTVSKDFKHFCLAPPVKMIGILSKFGPHNGNIVSIARGTACGFGPLLRQAEMSSCAISCKTYSHLVTFFGKHVLETFLSNMFCFF